MVNEFDYPLGQYSSINSKDSFRDYMGFLRYMTDMPLRVKRELEVSDSEMHRFFENYKNQKISNKSLFRRTETVDDYITNYWIGNVVSQEKIISILCTVNYTPLDVEVFENIAKLSSDINNIPKLPKILASYGILLIYEKSIPGSKIDGVVYLNENRNPVIGLSLRYDRVDYFWFTLMHEIAHILLHIESLDSPVFDFLTDDNSSNFELEVQANKLAADMLIPRSVWRTANVKKTNQEADLIELSNSIGIHPAIIAGRVRREKNNYSLFSKLITKSKYRDLL